MKLWTPELASGGQLYPCAKCGLPPSPRGHDGCLGELPDPNIMNSCCGHGDDNLAYIQYWDRSDVRDKHAISEQKRLIAKRDNKDGEQ